MACKVVVQWVEWNGIAGWDRLHKGAACYACWDFTRTRVHAPKILDLDLL